MTRDRQDRWARWLLERRHGGDAEQLKEALAVLAPIRDRVLEGAELAPEDVVLDVGCGDGLIGFGALARLGPEGKVVLSDLSEALVHRCWEIAASLGVTARSRFLVARAEHLPLASASVDVVTTRSVLIYIRDKPRAFAEFFRLLRPGGRLSVFEPINRYGYPEPAGQFWGYEVGPIQDLADRVRAVFQRTQAPQEDPMLDFDERDLVRMAEAAGFVEIRLTLEIEVKPLPPRREAAWKTVVRTAPNPHAPTLEEAVAQALTPAEAQRFLDHLRQQFLRGGRVSRSAVAYLRARKPT